MAKDIIIDKKPPHFHQRKHGFNIIDILTHVHLAPCAILQAGDEFYYEGSWFPVAKDRIGQAVGAAFIYRRPYNQNCQKRKFFSKKDIDLNNYRKVEAEEILMEGDIYLDGARWATTLCFGQSSLGPYAYFRKKNGISQTNDYRILGSDEIIRVGDECWNASDQKWYPVVRIGSVVGERFMYRRPKAFSDEELEKAAQHYNVKSTI